MSLNNSLQHNDKSAQKSSMISNVKSVFFKSISSVKLIFNKTYAPPADCLPPILDNYEATERATDVSNEHLNTKTSSKFETIHQKITDTYVALIEKINEDYQNHEREQYAHLNSQISDVQISIQGLASINMLDFFKIDSFDDMKDFLKLKHLEQFIPMLEGRYDDCILELNKCEKTTSDEILANALLKCKNNFFRHDFDEINKSLFLELKKLNELKLLEKSKYSQRNTLYADMLEEGVKKLRKAFKSQISKSFRTYDSQDIINIYGSASSEIEEEFLFLNNKNPMELELAAIERTLLKLQSK